jgi:hypothetical protein
MPNELPFTPLADPATPAPDPMAAAIGAPTSLIDDTNWAELFIGGTGPDAALIQEQISTGIYPLLIDLRSRRRQLESEWQAIDRMTFMLHDDGKRYNGRSNAYLPVWARAKATKVSALKKALFPSDEYMDCFDRNGGDPEAAAALKAWMQYQFDDVAQVRRYIDPFLEQYVSKGTSPLKYGWRTKDEVKQTRGSFKKGIASFLQDAGPNNPSSYTPGFYVSSRDIMNVYVYPETAESNRDILFVAEDMQIPTSYIRRMGSIKEWCNIEAALQAQDVESAKRQEKLSSSAGIPDTQYFYQNTVAELRVLCEIWCWMKLPKKAYREDEDPELPVPVRVVMPNMGGIPVLIRRNPLFTQTPPYVFGRQQVIPGLFYGQGDGRLIRFLQYLVNDFANQMNDTGIYALNPIMKVNPAHMVGPPPPLRPGVVYQMTDIKEGMAFDRPPVELPQFGQQLLSMYVSMVNDFAGVPPILQGSGSGRAAKTATGTQILQRNAMSPMQDQAEALENDVLLPMMQAAWRLGQQFGAGVDQLIVRGQPVPIPPGMFDIEPNFRWTASSQAQNQAMRAQQITQFLQMAMPMAQYLMQLGYKFDPVPLMQRFFNDGLGLRGFDQVVQKMMAPGPGAFPGIGMGTPPPPPGPGAPPPAPMQDIRSAVEQAPSGGIDIQPGEGEDFADVRSQADDLAGYLGSFTGGQ